MANKEIGELLARYQAGFNLLGRLTVLRGAAMKTVAPLSLYTSSRLFADLPEIRSAQSDIEIYTSFDLPPTGAIDYIRNLTPVTQEIFDGLAKQYQADAFTIAGVNDQRILDKVRQVLGEIVASGGTAAQFRRAVDEITDASGAARLSAFEVDTVFNTNVQKAYSTGRYEQMMDPSVLEALPFWQYWTVGDDRVRPEHEALHLFTARAIDPVWRKIYPPGGFNCRCSVVPILASEAPPEASEGGLERLPALVIEMVPQPGFRTILAA